MGYDWSAAVGMAVGASGACGCVGSCCGRGLGAGNPCGEHNWYLEGDGARVREDEAQ